MARVTNEARIKAAWKKNDQVWPPAINDKVRVFTPKALRGKSAKVIAVGDVKTKTSTRGAPTGKARVVVKTKEAGTVQFAVGQMEVIPSSVTLKELDNII